MDDGREDPRQAAARRALRETLAQAAREAGAAQAELRDSTATFRAVSRQVIDVVGGSAQLIDQELTRSLEEASYHTNLAVSALGMATSSTRAAL